MSLIYSSSNKIFLKQEVQKHSGNSACSVESPVEAFYVNRFINDTQSDAEFFEFDTPSYYTLGGTVNYYGQDYWSVFTNIYRPFIKFTFTANTDHFGTGTTMKHSVYRIPYKEYIEYTSEIIRQNIEQNKNSSVETVEETVVDASGNSRTTTTTKKTSISGTTEKTAPSSFPETIAGYGLEANDKYTKIKQMLNTPVLVVTATTTGISSYTYYLFLDEQEKRLGNFQQQLFQDYAQYFITTQFEFNREQAIGLSDFYQLSGNTAYSVEYQQYFHEITPNTEHVITGGTFSGVTVYGNFFTYFLIPNKPKWETPYVTGQLTTFSPTFYWSSGNDGDSYLLQVTYCSGDCQTFTGTVYSYPISKEGSNLSSDELLNLPDGDWSIAQKRTDTVREYSVPLSNGQTFWYRMGNVKELVNIFGIKQQVVTFSDIRSAITSSESYTGQVYVQSDSPYTEDSTSLTYPDYLDDGVTVPPTYTLTGSVSGSVVTGATIMLVYPNGNFITTPTDSVGNYSFPNLSLGTYGVGVSYRGYQVIDESTAVSVVVTGNTSAPLIMLNWLWGNEYETWGEFATHTFTS